MTDPVHDYRKDKTPKPAPAPDPNKTTPWESQSAPGIPQGTIVQNPNPGKTHIWPQVESTMQSR